MNRTVIDCDEKDGQLQVAVGPSPFWENPPEKDRQPLLCSTDQVLVCIGRRPQSFSMGLENIGVQTDDKGWITADERMQTSVNNVYAIGDILGPSRIMLAHAASAEGMVAAENATGTYRKMDYQAVPTAIFTAPEIACIGLSEQQAIAGGYEIRAESMLFRTIGKAQVTGEIAGEVKIVFDAKSGKVLGFISSGPIPRILLPKRPSPFGMGQRLETSALPFMHIQPTLKS